VAARSDVRGHEIVFGGSCTDTRAWRWADTGELVTDDDRPCAHCGRAPIEAGGVIGVDGCLGVLPGVASACCGHGDASHTFVLFTDGSGLEGERASQWQQLMRDRWAEWPSELIPVGRPTAE